MCVCVCVCVCVYGCIIIDILLILPLLLLLLLLPTPRRMSLSLLLLLSQVSVHGAAYETVLVTAVDTGFGYNPRVGGSSAATGLDEGTSSVHVVAVDVGPTGIRVLSFPS